MLFYKLHFVLMAITISISTAADGEVEEDMAAILNERFNLDFDKVVNEGKNRLPAYAYSGIFLRGLSAKPSGLLSTEHGWNLAYTPGKTIPISMISNKTIFTSKSFFGYGYIFFPPARTPEGITPLDIMCAFPFNALTVNRQYQCTSPLHKFCHELKINNLKKLRIHLRTTSPSNQCAFDMENEKQDAYEMYKIMAEVHGEFQLNPLYYLYTNNEFLIHAWNSELPKKIPIQAIFRNVHTWGSAEVARKLQNDLKDTTGRNVPIVNIRFPSNFEIKKRIVIENYRRKDKKERTGLELAAYNLFKSYIYASLAAKVPEVEDPEVED